MPEITAPRYNIDNDSALALRTQPMATIMPPKETTSFGPRSGPSMSTIQPSIGVSQVSRAMNIAKATWIEAMDQPCALLIGLTNSVQPYCCLLYTSPSP